MKTVTSFFADIIMILYVCPPSARHLGILSSSSSSELLKKSIVLKSAEFVEYSKCLGHDNADEKFWAT